MIESIAFFLMLSLIFYVSFAGADFGAGILEIFTPERHKEQVRKAVDCAISPVWEANHVWIILALVITFIAFPLAFQTLSVSFHLPLNIMLLGIICRGCAFIFRNYDPFKDVQHSRYSAVFAISSFITPFIQGVIAGGLILGRINLHANTFYGAYVQPWLAWFPFTTGLFLCSLCYFSACALLKAESDNEILTLFLEMRTRFAALICLLVGASVFVSARFSDLALDRLYFSDWISLGCFICGTLLFGAITLFIHKLSSEFIRTAEIALISFILIGWWKIQFPYLVGFPSGTQHSLNIYEIAAPYQTLQSLLIALVIGSVLIIPALLFLLKVFKSDQQVT